MIRVNFKPKNLEGEQRKWWEKWKKKSETAKQEVIESWQTWKQQGSDIKFDYEFNSDVWKELKDWLLEHIFHEKCAYCETEVSRFPFTVDHFRPKGRVSINVNSGNGRRHNEQVEHPGYFWLAYDWRNLLPSCANCNSGKRDLFPVSNTHVAVQYQQEQDIFLCSQELNEREQPLLLHPYMDDPSEHLVFGEQGIVAAVEDSQKGQHSIEVYNLNDEKLIELRRRAQDRAYKDYLLAMITDPSSESNLEEMLKRGNKAITGYLNGQAPYSAAVAAYIRLVNEKIGGNIHS